MVIKDMTPYNTRNYIENIFPCLATTSMCFGLIFVICLIGGAITFSVYSVIALLDNSNNSIQDVCSGSNLWSFLLVMLITGFLQSSQTASSAVSESRGAKLMSALCVVVVQVGFMVWAGLELWANRCAANNLSDNLVYRMVYAWFFISAAAFGLVITIVIIAGCMEIREAKAARGRWFADESGSDFRSRIVNEDDIGVGYVHKM
jgi:uncharacterized membrane protein YdjX (TVP38/TMEM64 family)